MQQCHLIDLRRPTAGRRPQPVLANIPLDEQPVMRLGNMFKSNFADPDLTVFHNTVVINQSQRATFNLFRSYDGISLRRAFNNIFLGIDNAGAVDRPLAYLPRVSDNAETDGNCYYGINREPRVLLVARPEEGAEAFRYQSAEELRDDEAYFDPSEIEHPPGFEAHGTSDNPRLRRFTGPLHFPLVEDLRLAPLGSAEHGGVKLSDPVLREMDGNPPDEPKPDIGCYPWGHPRWPSVLTASDSSRATRSHHLLPLPCDADHIGPRRIWGREVRRLATARVDGPSPRRGQHEPGVGPRRGDALPRPRSGAAACNEAKPRQSLDVRARAR
jgi:hypothetical protein